MKTRILSNARTWSKNAIENIYERIQLLGCNKYTSRTTFLFMYYMIFKYSLPRPTLTIEPLETMDGLGIGLCYTPKKIYAIIIDMHGRLSLAKKDSGAYFYIEGFHLVDLEDRKKIGKMMNFLSRLSQEKA